MLNQETIEAVQRIMDLERQAADIFLILQEPLAGTESLDDHRNVVKEYMEIQREVAKLRAIITKATVSEIRHSTSGQEGRSALDEALDIMNKGVRVNRMASMAPEELSRVDPDLIVLEAKQAIETGKNRTKAAIKLLVLAASSASMAAGTL